MTRRRIAIRMKTWAMLAAAAGMAAVGLLATPIASGEPPPNGQCPQGQFPKTDGTGCAGVPDPTQYGCPPNDFKCMFDSLGPPH
jgi:hypothetical protein